MSKSARERNDRLSNVAGDLANAKVYEGKAGQWVYEIKCSECWVPGMTPTAPQRHWTTTPSTDYMSTIGSWNRHMAAAHSDAPRPATVDIEAAELTRRDATT